MTASTFTTIADVQATLLNLLQHGTHPEALLAFQHHIDAPQYNDEQKAVIASSIQAAFAIQKQQTTQQQREKGLLAILETAQDLTAIRDLELLLQMIVRRARQIFGSDIGYLTNFDRARDDFYIRATDGATSERFRKVRVPQDHGICGHVLRHKTAYHCTNYMTDAGFTHDPDIDMAIADESVRAFMAAPLMIGNHCIGMLCVCDRQPRSHEPWEISMLSTLAAQAAIAIENARLFQETQVALQKLSDSHALIHQQSIEVASAADAHEKMMKLVTRGSSAADILQMIASLLDCDIALLDEAEQVTRYASSAEPDPLRVALPALMKEAAVQDQIHLALADSRYSGRSRALSHANAHLQLVSITGADRLLGALLMRAQHRITETQARTFERGALVVAVAILSNERNELALSSHTAAAIKALISWQQEPIAMLQARVKPLGLDLDQAMHMLLIQLESSHTEYALRRLKPFLSPGIVMEEYDGLIIALYPIEDHDKVLHAVQTGLLQNNRLNLVGVISEPLHDVTLIPKKFKSLKRCAEMLRALQRKNTLVPEASMGMYAFLFEQRDHSEIMAFIHAHLGQLLQHDHAKDSLLCDTLLSYLDHSQNLKSAAHTLNIHINTLRQRLEKIDTLLGPWRHSSRMLELHVALQIHKLTGAMADAHQEIVTSS